jgi:hypothetical protein
MPPLLSNPVTDFPCVLKGRNDVSEINFALPCLWRRARAPPPAISSFNISLKLLVRFYVGNYRLPSVEAWAPSHGATDLEIETARQCLSSTVWWSNFTATSHRSLEAPLDHVIVAPQAYVERPRPLGKVETVGLAGLMRRVRPGPPS